MSAQITEPRINLRRPDAVARKIHEKTGTDSKRPLLFVCREFGDVNMQSDCKSFAVRVIEEASAHGISIGVGGARVTYAQGGLYVVLAHQTGFRPVPDRECCEEIEISSLP